MLSDSPTPSHLFGAPPRPSRCVFALFAALTALTACSDGPKPPPDTAETPWDLVVEPALPEVPAAFGLRALRDTIVLRTTTGLWRSRDAGANFAAWTTAPAIDVLPRNDGSALQVRNRGTFGNEDLVLETVAADGSTIAGPTIWTGAGTWLGASFSRGAPGANRQWLQAFGRASAENLAPTRILQLPDNGGPPLELQLPDGAPAGSVWTIADAGNHLALFTFRADGSAFLAWRQTADAAGAWTEHELGAGLIDLVATHDGAFVVARVAHGAASLSRFEPATGAVQSHPVEHAFSLAVAYDGRVVAVSRTFNAPFSESGRVIFESADGGRSWDRVASSLDATTAIDARVQVATSGLWTLEGPFPTWRPHAGGHWRLAGLPSDMEVPFLHTRGDDIWMVGFKPVIPTNPDGGHKLFRSPDRGHSWHFAGDIGVSVGCFAVTPNFLFFGGAADVRGAAWETRDLAGRRLIRNDRVFVRDAPALAAPDIVACASSGGPSVVVAQAEPGKTPSILIGANMQHQQAEGRVEWSTWAPTPRHRVTALDGMGIGLEPIRAAGELLIQDVVGFNTLPQTGMHDGFSGEWTWSPDYFNESIGARGAVRAHGFLFVYATGQFHNAWRVPDSITGLVDQAVVQDAIFDAQGIFWLGTRRGLFRDTTKGRPVPPPPPAGCDADRDCAGFVAGADLCGAQTRCIDRQCVARPAVTCGNMPLSAPCRTWACTPATGQCEEQVVADWAFCNRIDMCHEPGQCQAGVCVTGAVVSCGGATECAPTRCDPARGCVIEHAPAGTACGVSDACTLPGRCNGRFDDCGDAAPRDCDDGNDCTSDSCSSSDGCVHVATREGQPCDDGFECTTGTTCVAGVCAGGEVVAACEEPPDPCDTEAPCADDGNPCTEEVCVAGLGCVARPAGDGSVCSHRDACRSDGICSNGWCVGGDESPDGTACATGAPCVTGESCFRGTCGGGQVLADGSTCNDSYGCTTNDRCEAGYCVGDVQGPASACQGLAACADCRAPAGPALLVAFSEAGGAGGVVVLTPTGALARVIDVDGFDAIHGVEPDRIAGDGFWITTAEANALRSIYKVGWDGEVREEIVITGVAANQVWTGGIDHLAASALAPEVLIIKAGSQQKAIIAVERETGVARLQMVGVGIGNALHVDAWEPTTRFEGGRPVYWTGDFANGRTRLVHARANSDVPVTVLPLPDAIQGITRAGPAGDLWVVTVAFDSLLSRVSPQGQRLGIFRIPLPGDRPGPDRPRAFDAGYWPGR